MKLNISNPSTGQNLPLVVDDEKKLLQFFGKRMGQEVDASILGDNWKNYILKITGGNDKDGFPMKQGIPLQGRTRILMSEGHSTYRPRRTGERKKKSVRGCIVGSDLAVLSLTVVRQGDSAIEGLTNEKRPRRRGPKRATRVRKLFALAKKDDPRRYVLLYSRKIEKNGKLHWKTPKIQRLVTPERLRRKKLFGQAKKGYKAEATREREYTKLIKDVKKRNIAKKAHEIGVEKANARAASQPVATKATKAPAKETKKVDPKAAGKTQPAGKTTAPAKGQAAPKTQAQPTKAAPKEQPKTTAPKTTAPKKN